MKFKSKIVLFVCSFSLIFSLVSVSCFAYSSAFSVGDQFVFDEAPDLVSLTGAPLSFDISGEFSFSYLDPDGNILVFDGLVIDDWVLTFSSSSSSFRIVYDSEWTLLYDEFNYYEISPPTFNVMRWGYISSYVNEWFLLNTTILGASSDSFYGNLYNSISDGIFGVGADLTPEQVMTLTLISTVLSYAFILLPLLLVIGFVLRCFRL